MMQADADVAATMVEVTFTVCMKEIKVLFDPGSTYYYLSPSFAKDINAFDGDLVYELAVATPIGKKVICTLTTHNA